MRSHVTEAMTRAGGGESESRDLCVGDGGRVQRTVVCTLVRSDAFPTQAHVQLALRGAAARARRPRRAGGGCSCCCALAQKVGTRISSAHSTLSPIQYWQRAHTETESRDIDARPARAGGGECYTVTYTRSRIPV